MKPLLHASATALITLSLTLSAHAATDKLGRVKAGKARETPMNEVSESIDGLQAASTTELKTHCASLKQEREAVEKEVEDLQREARIAEGALVDVKTVKPGTAAGPARGEPKVASATEAAAKKKAVMDARARRAMLGCQLYALGEIQAAKAKKKTVVTKDLMKKCFEGKEMPEVTKLTCEDDKAPKTK